MGKVGSGKPLHILILEDRPADAELVVYELRAAGFKFVAKKVTTEHGFLAELRKHALQLILADYSLPGYDGLAALAAARKYCPEVPFIFVSGSLGEEKAIETLHRGATDYVLKDRLARLGPAVRRALRERKQVQKREQAEQKQREAETRYHALFEESPDGIVIFDPELARPLEFNTAAHRQLGYSHEEFARLSIADIEANEPPEQTLATLKGMRRNGKRDFEIQQRTREGQIRHVHVTAQIVEIAGRSVYHCIWRDITERKRAEATLQRREAYFRTLTEGASDIITVLDAQAIVRYESPSVEQVFGYKPEELVGQVAFDLIHPDDRVRVQRTFVELSAKPGSTIRIEFQYRHKDASWRTLEATARNLLEDPNVTGIIVNSRDITQRQQLEEALSESSQFNHQIVASAHEGIIVYGLDLRYQAWNPFMERLTGRPASEVLGKHPHEVFPLLREAGVLDSIQKILAGEPSSSIEFHFNGFPSGVSGWASHTNGPLRNAAGEIIGVIGIVRDITGRKRDELRIAAFASLGQRLNAAKTAREASEIIVDVADRLLGWDCCLFDLYSAAENRVSHLLNMDIIGGRRTECFPQELHKPPSEIARRAIEQGGQLILRDDPRAMRPNGRPFGDTSRPSASIMFVPIRHGAEVVGVFSIQSYTPRAYDAYSLETLQSLADHGGGALERLRAQRALDESEATFRSVWERSIDGMRLTDKEGRIIAVNEAFCRLVKLPRERLEGQLFSVVYKGHGPADGIEAYHKRFADGEMVPRHSPQVQLWNSDEVDLEISNSFVELGRRGKMLLSIFRDASERKRAELRIQAFSQLGQRLSATKTVREAAGIISEVAGELIGWDACLFSLVLPGQELVDHVLQVDRTDGQRVEYHPGYEPPSAMARRAIEAGGQLILKEQPDQMLPGGQPFGDASRPSASMIYVPVRKGKEVVGVMSIQSYTPRAYDERSLETVQALADHCGGAIDRLRLQEAWQTTQDRLGHLLTQSPAVIYSLKTNGITTEPVWVSDNIEQLLGYTAAECHGPEGPFSQLHPQDRQAVIDGLVHLVLKKRIARDYRVRHKNGQYRWVRDEQRLVCDTAGAPVEIVGSWMDITERKALEEQLRQSQKMEAVGQLAGGVAHDFNNMLAVIRGNAELILMDGEQFPAEVRDGLRQVVDASDRAANLTRQLLAFSRKQVMQPQPLVLNDVIANLTKMLKRVIGENIDLQCHYAALLPHVQADTGMLEQVILNLVVNARDAMPEGGRLRVVTEHAQFDEAQARLHPGARAGEFVCLLVSDTGTGIAPEVLPRIFEPFFTTKAVGKGTGLGLATVYGIVQQHQGWLEVSSQIGQGTTIKVLLPAIPAPSRRETAAEAGREVRGGMETILLVEDDDAVRLTTRRVLESKGYRIREATSAREGLEVWQAHAGEISLLLTDIIMPGGETGRDLAEKLWAQRPAMKVVFMSGYSADVVGRNTDFIRRTNSHFLQKPCSSRALLETVRRCLDARGAPAEPEEKDPTI